MQKSQFNSSHAKATAFIDYRPAELRVKSQWLVIYYAKNPLTQQLERQRVSVPVCTSKSERMKLGKKMVLEINRKLESGWLPFYSGSTANDYKTLEFCFTNFIKQTEEEVQKGNKRPDTLRAYNSYISMLRKFILEKHQKITLVLEFNKVFVTNYLDWIYFERKNSATTYNNHLTFITNFVNYCIGRGWLKQNFTAEIQRKKKQSKIRQILALKEKQKVKKMEVSNHPFFTLCMATYYCFIRRTELTKLKVKDVKLFDNYIEIDQSISKNGKTETATIPNSYLPVLAKHLHNANNDEYVFSTNDFKPGKKQLNPKKISDTWEKFRKENKIDSEYQFYSLKDTGITDLLNSGVPAIKVRDQARHYDLKITESYTARNKSCDETVKNSNFSF